MSKNILDKLSKQDLEIIVTYTNHLKSSKDIKTELDVLKELKWLTKHDLCREVKRDVYDRTKRGNRLMKIIKQIEKMKTKQKVVK